MLSKLRPRLTYANVVSTVCLFIVLGGTSYAVATGSIDSREIKNNSIRSKDVHNKSLLAQDFAPGQLQAGPKGDTGAPGADGTARAYAHVNDDGTLDAARSKNVLDVRPACESVCLDPPPPAESGSQCFRLGFAPKSAVASAETNTGSGFGQKSVSVKIPAKPMNVDVTGCAAGYQDAMTTTVAVDNGFVSSAGFYIVFN